MEFSEDESDNAILDDRKHKQVDVNQNYLIERIISGTKTFLNTNLFHRYDMKKLAEHKLDNDDATEAADGIFAMNLRSNCSGNCVMQGLPHSHHHHK